eukprot:1502100-Alexandrium_andersonii.AAC.1
MLAGACDCRAARPRTPCSGGGRAARPRPRGVAAGTTTPPAMPASSGPPGAGACSPRTLPARPSAVAAAKRTASSACSDRSEPLSRRPRDCRCRVCQHSRAGAAPAGAAGAGSQGASM